MKKLKWFGATGAVMALAAAGFIAAPQASGAITVTAGPGSRVTCDVSGTMKITPTLANNWDKSDHTNDPNANATIKAGMASIPNTTYSVGHVPLTSTGKIASSTCTGTLKDATTPTNTASVTAAAISTSVITGAVDATCIGVVNILGATFQTIIKWTGSAKITPTTVTTTSGIASDAHGTGMLLTSDPADVSGGSFQSAGAHSVTTAYVDGGTVLAFAAGPATYDAPVPFGTCQPALSAKFTAASPGVSDAFSAKLKKPKGLKQIGIVNGGTDNFPSHLCFQSSTTASC